MSNKSYRIGLTGIFLGSICLATIYLITVYGPASYSVASSGSINANGTVSMIVTRSSELPRIAQTAFYLLLVSLVAAIVSVVRKEAAWASLGALAFGLAPLLLMTLGAIVTGWLYFGILLPAASVVLIRRFRK